MAYIIPLLFIALGLSQPKSKLVTFVFLLYFWVLMGLNTFTPDYEEYEEMYSFIFMFPYIEYGFQGLCYIGNFLGLSYQEFRMVYAAIYVMFVYIATVKLSPYRNYVLAMFLVWPFLPGVSGLRQSLANMIVCCGIPCLFKNGKGAIAKYLCWIFLASFIHQSCLFYVVFIFARKQFTIREKIYIIIGIGIGMLVIVSSTIFGNLSDLLGMHKIEKWMNRESDAADRTNFAGFLIRSFFVCCYAYFVPMLEKIINRHVCLADYDKKRIRICANTSLLLLLTIPGYLVSGEYQRLLYGMLFVYYALFAEFRFIKFEKAYVQRFHVVVVFWIIVIFTAWYYMFSMTSHDVMATLKDNLLFK